MTSVVDSVATDRWLVQDLQQPGTRHDPKQRIWLESKADIKRRGGHSPDDGDALALTFAAPVTAPRVLRLVSDHDYAAGQGSGLGYMA